MMQEIKFFKYQGAGNDFIIMDNREMMFEINNRELIAHLCDRKFGIGADGLMLLERSIDTDFEMLYYNADGGLGSLCGNGGRCIVAFAKKIGLVETETTFRAADGLHYAKINADGDYVSLQMKDVACFNRNGEDYILNTGSPHYVKVVSDLATYDVYAEGMAIRNRKLYKQAGINVNFIESASILSTENKANQMEYAVRTFERGVENETLACGTGVTAVAIAMALEHEMEGEIVTHLHVRGGELKVRFIAKNNCFSRIFLEGPATFVFEGRINPSPEF